MAQAERPPSSGEPEHFEPGVIAGLPAELPAELALARLPAGRHGLPRSFIDRNQRLRLVAGMLAVLHRRGYAATTIGHVTREAGVSRAAFYSQFASKEECFLATYDLAAGWLCERVESASAAAEGWPIGVSAGVSKALGLLAANPPVARLLTVEALQAGAASRRRQQACIAHLAEALRAGRRARPELPADLEELLLGGAFSLIGRHVENGRAEQLPNATVELVQCLLMPYLEPGETKRIAAQAA